MVMFAFAILLVAVPAHGVDAQQRLTRTEPDTYDEVGYVGGLSTQREAIEFGRLVLSDSGVAYWRCTARCAFADPRHDSVATMFVRYSDIKSLTTTNGTRGGAGPGGIGEFIAIVFETAARSEGPLFRVGFAHSVAVDAQIRFLARKAGTPIPPTSQ